MGLFRNKRAEALEHQLLHSQRDVERLTRRVAFMEAEAARLAVQNREALALARKDTEAADRRADSLQNLLAEERAKSVVVPIRGAGGKFAKRGG